jgi:stage V sporulation protein B
MASKVLAEYFANFAATVPAILAAVPVYFFILIRLGSFTEDDILGLPKGTAMVRLLKKVRWL